MSQSYASQASIRLTAPASGGAEVVESKAGALLQLGFDPQAASFERTGTDLTVKVDGGGILVLQGFFKVGDEPLPTFVLADGGQIPAGTLLTSLDPNFDISTAAGPSASSSSSGSGEYDGDAGEGLAGLDRLGSLGTDQWAYDESVELESVTMMQTVDSGLSADPFLPEDVIPTPEPVIPPTPPVPPVPPTPVDPEPIDPEPGDPEPVNMPPVANDLIKETTEGGESLSDNFNNLVSDADGDSLVLTPGKISYTDAEGYTREVSAEEAGVTFGPEGDWKVDPTAPLYKELDKGEQGKLEISYTADDGQASDEGVVRVIINGVTPLPHPDIRAVLYGDTETVSIVIPDGLPLPEVAFPEGWNKGYAMWEYNNRTGRIDISLTEAGEAYLENNPKAVDYLGVTVGDRTYTVEFIAIPEYEESRKDELTYGFDSAAQNAEDAAAGLGELSVPGEFHSGRFYTYDDTFTISTISEHEGADDVFIDGGFFGNMDVGAGNDLVTINGYVDGIRGRGTGTTIINTGSGNDTIAGDQFALNSSEGTIIIDTGSGDDNFIITEERINANYHGNINILTGAGNDLIDITPGTYVLDARYDSTINIDAGSGDDSVNIHGSALSINAMDGGSHVSVVTGEGNDNIDMIGGLQTTTEETSIVIDTGVDDDTISDDDVLSITGRSSVRGQISIFTRSGNDTLNINGDVESSDDEPTLLIDTGSGDDIISLDGKISGDFQVDGGEGYDTLVLHMEGTMGNYVLNDDYGTSRGDTSYADTGLEAVHFRLDGSWSDAQAQIPINDVVRDANGVVTSSFVTGTGLLTVNGAGETVDLDKFGNILDEGDSVSKISLLGGESGSTFSLTQDGFDDLMGDGPASLTVTCDAASSFDASSLLQSGWEQAVNDTVVNGQSFDTYTNVEGDQLLVSTLITNVTTG